MSPTIPLFATAVKSWQESGSVWAVYAQPEGYACLIVYGLAALAPTGRILARGKSVNGAAQNARKQLWRLFRQNTRVTTR